MGYLTFRSVSLQEGADALSGGIWLDMPIGYSEPADVRGEDDVIPEAAGREVGRRTKDVRRIQLEGHVRGVGGTAAERSADWRSATDALMAVMQLDDDPGLLEVAGDYLGIPSGTTMELNARVTRVIPGPITNRMSFQTWSFELLCIDSPPEWTEQAS